MTTPHPKFNFNSSLGPLLEQFLTLRLSLGYAVTANSSLYAYRELDYFFSFHGLSRPDQIDERAAVRWMFAIPSHSNRTKNMRLQRLRGFCRFLIHRNLLKIDPTSRLPPLREKPSPKPHLYSLQELGTMLDVAARWTRRPTHRFTGFLIGAFIHLVYACGLRLSEAINIKLKDLDFHENTISLWKTKFHKERLIPLSHDSAERLRYFLLRRSHRFPSQCGPDNFLFCHKNGKFSSCGMFYLFRGLLRETGLAKSHGPRIHDLRHSFAVHRLYKWYQDGADPLNKLPHLSTFMGHVGIVETQVYLTVTQDLLREGDKRFQALCEESSRRKLPKRLS